MDPEDALRAVRGLAKANRFRLTVHAAREAAECGATRAHIRCALTNANNIRPSGENQASDWTVLGPDLDGDDLDLRSSLKMGS